MTRERTKLPTASVANSRTGFLRSSQSEGRLDRWWACPDGDWSRTTRSKQNLQVGLGGGSDGSDRTRTNRVKFQVRDTNCGEVLQNFPELQLVAMVTGPEPAGCLSSIRSRKEFHSDEHSSVL